MVGGSLRGVDHDRSPEGACRDDSFDLDDFPAAVVCAHCGRGDCLGTCEGTDGASQVFAIIPWERSNGSWTRRLWGTARLATLNHEAFFGSLPGGKVAPALRFAIIAELVTITFHLTLGAGLACALVPALPRALLTSDALRLGILRGSLVGVPLAAATAVGLHVLHGVGLDLGARLQGGHPRHGVRFGCYACGWDLLTLPLGVLLTALTVGPRPALRALSLGVTAPRRAGAAYLRGVHQLAGAPLGRALRMGGAVPAATALALALLAIPWLLLALQLR